MSEHASIRNPSWTQRARRRQHVLPDPHPISFGSICHGRPQRKTNRMPVPSWPEKYKFQPDGGGCSMCRDSAVTSEMSHQWLRLVGLGLMVASAGCGSSSPAPVPSTVVVPSPVPVQLSGVATDDDGAPVSGVTVFVYPW